MNASLVERAWRRILMLVGAGNLTTGNDAGDTQLWQVQLGADEVRDQTPRLAEYGFASMPLPGADALVLFVAGDRSAGVIVATGDRRYRLKPLAGGEVALYDDLGHVVKLGRTGIAINGGGHNIAITGAPQVTVTGGDVIADGISLKNHKHGGVTTGSGDTGLPHA